MPRWTSLTVSVRLFRQKTSYAVNTSVARRVGGDRSGRVFLNDPGAGCIGEFVSPSNFQHRKKMGENVGKASLF